MVSYVVFYFFPPELYDKLLSVYGLKFELLCHDCIVSYLPIGTDAVAYAALLRNELLGAGIETVPDPHTDDRRQAVLSQDTHSLFRVSSSQSHVLILGRGN